MPSLYTLALANEGRGVSQPEPDRLVHESRMIRMIGLIILAAQIIILMTRMIALIRKNIGKGNKIRHGLRPRPSGAGNIPDCVFCTFPNVFAYLGYHPSHLDDYLAN